MLLKFGLAHQAGGLLARAAKNESSSRIVYDVRKILEGLQTGGVDRRHVSQTKNDDGRQLRKSMDDLFDLVRGAEEKRAMNAEDGYVGRDFLVLQNMDVPFSQILIGDLRYGRRDRNLANEHESGQNHSRFDGHGQIREYRK